MSFKQVTFVASAHIKVWESLQILKTLKRLYALHSFYWYSFSNACKDFYIPIPTKFKLKVLK